MGRRKLVRILLESPQIDIDLKNQQNEAALDIGNEFVRSEQKESVTRSKSGQ